MYWVRRLLILTVLAAVVVGFVGLGRLLTGASDGRSGEAQAAASADRSGESPEAGKGTDTAPSRPAATGSGESDPDPDPDADPRKTRKSPKPPPAQPDGPCAEEDVVVTPSVKQAVGGSPIAIRLDLTTVESEACWWEVSPDTLALRITSGDDETWSSRQCPGALPERSVVVRQDRRQRIRVQWSARRSDEECSRLTEWALPGDYRVEAAAYAGEPRDEQFEVTRPKRPVVTRTAEPELGPGQGQGQGRQERRQAGG